MRPHHVQGLRLGGLHINVAVRLEQHPLLAVRLTRMCLVRPFWLQAKSIQNQYAGARLTQMRTCIFSGYDRDLCGCRGDGVPYGVASVFKGQ